jgi:hypothetical protein
VILDAHGITLAARMARVMFTRAHPHGCVCFTEGLFLGTLWA